MGDKGQKMALSKTNPAQGIQQSIDSIVLDKSIFSNVFDKDIRRVYIYKKSERIAKAIQLILPAFSDSTHIRERLSGVGMRLIDAAVLPPREARESLSRELLALASVLSVARAGGMLSPMNAEIMSREAHLLLEEMAGYDDPKVSLEDIPTLSSLSRATPVRETRQLTEPRPPKPASEYKGQDKGQDNKTGRRESIVSILRTKGPSYIKDISTMIREVSEKTIQRELQELINQGRVKKTGERRWTIYELTEGEAA
jgi:hypothetical protein